MKRNERTTYNQLKKTVTTDTIYVEVPLTWTHEARQAIHELLTIEKGMYASCIGPEVISGAECIRYTHASEYTAQTRQEQESTDVDEVVQSLHRTEYTWNGYKPTADTTDTTTAQPEGKKEEKNMESTVKYVYEEKTRNGYKQTYECTDATKVYNDLTHELISKKINACQWIKAIKRTPLYNGYQKITVTYDHGGRRIYTVTDH